MKPFTCFFTLLLLSAIAFHPFAQSPLRTGSDYAVFFYVTMFQNGWDKLPETEAEVKAIASELESNYGFKVELVPNPTKQQVFDKIVEVNKRKYSADDQVLFFFSTHGHFNKDTDRGYLVLADGRLYDQYGTSWLSYDDLGSFITASPCRHVMLALDACYSGSFGDRWKGPPDELPWDNTDCKGLAKNALTYASRIYFTSGNREQRTPAKSRFAKQWLAALREGAEKGVLRKKNIRSYLDDVDFPEPEGGSFSSKHEAGGDFVFVYKNACSTTPGLTSDQQHWLSIQSDFSKANLQKHLDMFSNCQHKEVLNSLGIGQTTVAPDDLPDMIFVQGGTFQMGSNDGDSDEKPIHSVTVSDFNLKITEETVEEFGRFITATSYQTDADKNGGSYIWNGTEWKLTPGVNWKCDATGKVRPTSEKNHPVIHVSWNDAVAYCNWRSEQDGLQKVYSISGSSVTPNWNANGYRLPTEAEWEFAARSRGKDEKWAGTNSESSLSTYANATGSSDGYEYTAPVRSFRANGLGLYDMSGNVWEWCWDWKADYPSSSQTNPHGPDSGSSRVLRGGSWDDGPSYLRCAYRGNSIPDNRYGICGFRLARAAR
ncbi:MAG: SUMF1/EgtB/PvdO family nonheme iron enzyme [Saprospiraceae bacterium]|nr:SUMF1/EgtB/PvdO family nonheme iron enzyme [Saprospiraceae bacterium]